MIGVSVTTLDELLDLLAAEGLIWVVRRPQRLNFYVLLFADETVPTRDQARFERFTRSRIAGGTGVPIRRESA